MKYPYTRHFSICTIPPLDLISWVKQKSYIGGKITLGTLIPMSSWHAGNKWSIGNAGPLTTPYTLGKKFSTKHPHRQQQNKHQLWHKLAITQKILGQSKSRHEYCRNRWDLKHVNYMPKIPILRQSQLTGPQPNPNQPHQHGTLKQSLSWRSSRNM